jgi:23S rRNA pseudouridine2605 synthase
LDCAVPGLGEGLWPESLSYRNDEKKGVARQSAERAPSNVKKVGLARALSKLGFCSRTQAIALIREGQVRLNGTTPRNPEAPVRLGVDRVEIAGRPLRAVEKAYLMMNKPRGIVTSAADEKGRDTVYSLLPEGRDWLAPVGRLDKASEGLLLLTNDSEWAARITNPTMHLEKSYHVQIATKADERLIEALGRGVEAQKGEMLRARRVSMLREGEKNSWLIMILMEGKNRHIRRMLEAYGVEVLRLVRVAIGPLPLGDLPKGAFRALHRGEKAALDRATGIKSKSES